MCEKCTELTAKIDHYRWFTIQSFDRLTKQRIEGLICDLEQIRDSMHPATNARLEKGLHREWKPIGWDRLA